ncbi:hypothetical protein Tco_0740562 [Tanacetum coccineum]
MRTYVQLLKYIFVLASTSPSSQLTSSIVKDNLFHDSLIILLLIEGPVPLHFTCPEHDSPEYIRLHTLNDFCLFGTIPPLGISIHHENRPISWANGRSQQALVYLFLPQTSSGEPTNCYEQRRLNCVPMNMKKMPDILTAYEMTSLKKEWHWSIAFEL